MTSPKDSDRIRGAVKKSLKEVDGIPADYRVVAFSPILSYFLNNGSGAGEDIRKPTSQPRQKQEDPPQNKGGKSGKGDKIREMIGDGFFKKPTTIGEIQSELRARGFPTKLTSMPKVVLPFIRSGALKRKVTKVGTKEQFTYFV